MGKWITPTMDVIVLGDRLYKTLTVIEYEAELPNIPACAGQRMLSMWILIRAR